MGRTLPSITQVFLQERQSLARFRRALRREDQRILDELLVASRQHLAAAAYASHLLPFEVMLLSMLLEQHKEVVRLRRELEAVVGAIQAVSHPVQAESPSPPKQYSQRHAGQRCGTNGELPLPDHDSSLQED